MSMKNEYMKKINDRYEILSVLGNGGMGTVYKAYDNFLKRIVAIKTLHKQYSSNTRARNMFLNEAITCIKLTHENIIKIYDANSFNNSYFMVMEFVDGIDLKSWLTKHNNIEEREAKKMICIIMPVLKALNYAHAYTIHRDIKPANIMITKATKDRNSRVILMDFGIAKAMNESEYENKTIMGSAMGTKNYMSPEQAYNASDIDVRTDIYSIGVVFYEMLTMTKPINSFIGNPYPPSKYNSTVTREIDSIVLKMISDKRDKRYKSMKEVIEQLEIAYRMTLGTKIFNSTNLDLINNTNINTTVMTSTNSRSLENKKNIILKETVLIPQGKFLRGSGIESLIESEQPRRSIFLDDFCIGIYTISNSNYKLFLDEVGYEKPERFDEFYEKYPNRPVVNVSWLDAKAFCEWCGGNLPTEAQWEKAASGPKNYIYPWGNQLEISNANIGYTVGEIVNVDEFESGKSGYGCYQMAGNVWEWCLDDFLEDFYKKSDDVNPICQNGSKEKVIRGGSFDFVYFSSRVSFRFFANLDTKAENIGFRIVFNRR